ncbi:MarR family transcriptional regulator [Longimycelium tulufanense]|uniref:MarR family transcriptional regulator n=1 Tax=Longimycelium tulufanense TaxID=907463 RepID=A0A8J3CC36_9PSEU|nr:MarR family transcriptional regulator [Longimycelium tulufanense]GGM45746.1 MarR family transcriptional regulator [Longimycelium tulufanense]
MRHRDRHPADVVASVEAALEPLLLVWGRAAEQVHPRVSAPQLRALLTIARHGVINLRRLGEEIGAIASSTSRLCDRLQAAGLITRHSGTADRREVLLRLTPEARRLLAELEEARRVDLGTVLGRMTPEGQRALLCGLREFGAAAGVVGSLREKPA